jgi:hypothetical protein
VVVAWRATAVLGWGGVAAGAAVDALVGQLAERFGGDAVVPAVAVVVDPVQRGADTSEQLADGDGVGRLAVVVELVHLNAGGEGPPPPGGIRPEPGQMVSGPAERDRERVGEILERCHGRECETAPNRLRHPGQVDS